MADDPQTSKWWFTMPGILTAVAAIITAITGLIAALNQSGALGLFKARGVDAGATSAPADIAQAGNTHVAGMARELTAGQQAELPDARYQLLSAKLAPYNAEKQTLTFTIRMTNKSRYPANFWDDSFRLLVNGAPLSPVSQLNKLVQGESAEEGEITFLIKPPAPDALVLRIHEGDEATDLPLQLKERKPG